MPSGFQQDSNQLQPAFFRVVLDMSNSDIYVTGNADGAGAVNPYSWDNFTGNDQPITLENAIRLAQGNIRFQRIVEELSKYSDAQIIDLECNFEGGNVTGNVTGTLTSTTTTSTALGAIGNAVNTSGKALGTTLYNTTTKTFYVAQGATAGSTWIDSSDGTTTITPA